MYGQQPVYGQPVPPPMPAYGQPPPQMPVYGQPPPQPMAMPMPVQQQQPQQQVTTTTTTQQDLGADGKPGSVWSRNSCCFIVLILLILGMIAGANSMHKSIGHSIEKAANRDEAYAVVGMKNLCDNPQDYDAKISGKNKGKCVDFKGKWHVKKDITIRSESGFKDDVIDSKCTKIIVKTEMWAEYKRCRNRKNNRDCSEGERDCSCTTTQEFLKDNNDYQRAVSGGFVAEYGSNFPCRDCLGSKEYDNGDNVGLRQTKGNSASDQLVSEELKDLAIKELGSEELSFGNTNNKEICLTNWGGNHYTNEGGFYANKINNENVFDFKDIMGVTTWTHHNPWANCGSPQSGDYRITATCVAPSSDDEIRIIGGLDSDGVRLGGYKPEEGVSDKNKEKILIWEKDDMNTENKDLIVKHQNKERAESKQVIQSKRTGRNVMIGLAFVFVLVFSGLCLFG